jgi:hypothetical protein
MDESDFVRELNKEKEAKHIQLLYRGATKKFAFERLGLDLEFSTINQFAEKLFLFGEKSKYFWNEKISSENSFEINDTSDVFFEFIFKNFNKLIQSPEKKGSKKYFRKKENHLTIDFFKDIRNQEKFIGIINKLSEDRKFDIRNYYLRILHQLGETSYKDVSHFLSSSSSEEETGRFSKKEITIYFWQPKFISDFSILNINSELLFNGKPYETQKEISPFTSILPHFIYCFKYKETIYFNPAIKEVSIALPSILFGLPINQENFIEELKTTNYKKGVTTIDLKNFNEIRG